MELHVDSERNAERDHAAQRVGVAVHGHAYGDREVVAAAALGVPPFGNEARRRLGVADRPALGAGNAVDFFLDVANGVRHSDVEALRVVNRHFVVVELDADICCRTVPGALRNVGVVKPKEVDL